MSYSKREQAIYMRGYRAGEKAGLLADLAKQVRLLQAGQAALLASNLRIMERVTLLEAERVMLDAQVRQAEEWSN